MGKPLAIAEARFYMYMLDACSVMHISWRKIFGNWVTASEAGDHLPQWAAIDV